MVDNRSYSTPSTRENLIVSRKSRARRKARRARALSLWNKPVVQRPPWGSGPELTEEERARVMSRFRTMKFRSLTWHLVTTTWVYAKTPEELEGAVRQELIKTSKGRPLS